MKPDLRLVSSHATPPVEMDHFTFTFAGGDVIARRNGALMRGPDAVAALADRINQHLNAMEAQREKNPAACCALDGGAWSGDIPDLSGGFR